MAMEFYQEKANGNGIFENGHAATRHTPHQPAIKVSLAWLDLRVFYVRINKCEIDDSTPEFLTLNHIPLNRDTLLEVNGVRTSYYSDGVSILLRRDRLDKKSEEVTFVSTDSLRMTGSVKFEVFDKDVLVLSGVLDLCHSNGVCTSNGLNGESKNRSRKWKMNCETELVAGNGFLKGKQNLGMESEPPAIEVCLAGSFGGNPIILTKNMQLSVRKKQTRKGMLESIPEYEATENQRETSPMFPLQQVTDYPDTKLENEEYGNFYPGMEYFEGEDGELSWFNAGVRVGVGIGLSVCLGIGIGVGLLVRTYQGTTRTFRRRLI